MTDEVKSGRRYESPRRREQALETRDRILDAAHTLFARDGYAPTTIAAVAKEAGVAVKTVYLAFETKAGVLRALWNRQLRGGDERVPVADQAWYREMLAEPDPVKQLKLNARNARQAKERMGDLLEVIRTAAASEPELAGLWQRIQTEFHANQRRVAESLKKKRALRRGLTVERAADVLWTLNHPAVWLLLVGERGWSPDEFEKWLAGAFCSELLRERAG